MAGNLSPGRRPGEPRRRAYRRAWRGRARVPARLQPCVSSRRGDDERLLLSPGTAVMFVLARPGDPARGERRSGFLGDASLSTFLWDAQERTRTSTALRPPDPESGASTNSATWARGASFYEGRGRVSRTGEMRLGRGHAVAIFGPGVRACPGGALAHPPELHWHRKGAMLICRDGKANADLRP